MTHSFEYKFGTIFRSSKDKVDPGRHGVRPGNSIAIHLAQESFDVACKDIDACNKGFFTNGQQVTLYAATGQYSKTLQDKTRESGLHETGWEAKD